MLEKSDTSRELPLVDGMARPSNATPLLSEGAGPQNTEAGHDREPAKEDEIMLDVHPAHHAASSWKEFFIHIATIVLGLLIAVGLEQTVELVHHRDELAQIRRELAAERETNREALAKGAKYWRWEAVELENNLMVLAYLQKHPGTADENLPGSLVWSYVHEPHSEAVWDAAKTSGVTSLMSREEIEQYEDMYNKLRQVDDARVIAWESLNDASRYQFTESRLSHLTTAQIAEVITLTQTAMNKHWLQGVALENLAAKYKDFPPSITPDELSQAHNRQNIADGVKSPAFAATISRMQAAGFGR
jgi:hypothetical protein